MGRASIHRVSDDARPWTAREGLLPGFDGRPRRRHDELLVIDGRAAIAAGRNAGDGCFTRSVLVEPPSPARPAALRAAHRAAEPSGRRG